jgi:hypothetical protein
MVGRMWQSRKKITSWWWGSGGRLKYIDRHRHRQREREKQRERDRVCLYSMLSLFPPFILSGLQPMVWWQPTFRSFLFSYCSLEITS